MTDNNPFTNVKKMFANRRESHDKTVEEEKKKHEATHSDYKKEIPDLIKKVVTRLIAREEGLAYPLKTSDKWLVVKGMDKEPRPCWHLVSQGSPWHDLYLTLNDKHEGILVDRKDAWADDTAAYDYQSETDLDFLKLVRNNLQSIILIKDDDFKTLDDTYTTYTWRK